MPTMSSSLVSLLRISGWQQSPAAASSMIQQQAKTSSVSRSVRRKRLWRRLKRGSKRCKKACPSVLNKVFTKRASCAPVQKVFGLLFDVGLAKRTPLLFQEGWRESAGVVVHTESFLTDHPVRSFKGCFAAFSLGRVHPSCFRRGSFARATLGNPNP